MICDAICRKPSGLRIEATGRGVCTAVEGEERDEFTNAYEQILAFVRTHTRAHTYTRKPRRFAK